MANKRTRINFSRIALFLCLVAVGASSTPVSIPLGSVSDLLIQSALDSLNENSPTRHTYKSGNLISAQKLLEPPYVIYRLTLNLEPNCDQESSPCAREACAIDLRQHELGVIDVQENSMQCMYIYPQSSQDDIQQHGQEIIQEPTSMQDMESFDKRVANESVQLDHEVQTVTDGSDRPFIAVRAIDGKYCAGCPYELNPSLPGLAAFGEQVVQSMDDSGRSDFKHKVVSIVRVTRAVPPGSNVVQYELLLEIGESNCLRTGLSSRAECSLLTNIPIKLCLALFEERPWQPINKSRRMTRNNCTDVLSTENELDGGIEARRASESLASSASRGEQSTPEATSRIGIYDRIAEEGTIGSFGSSIDEFFEGIEPTSSTGVTVDADAGLAVTEETLTKIVLSTEDVEPKNHGFTDKMREFDEFLQDFDVKIKHRDPKPIEHGDPVTEEMIRPKVVLGPSAERNSAKDGFSRSKRSPIDTRRDEKRLVRELAQKALDTLDDIDVDNKRRVVLKVIDSRKEEADGTVYYVTMKVASTRCNENTDECFDRSREHLQICKVHIHTDDERPLESAKVLQSQCFPETSRRRETRVRRAQRIVGARTTKSTDDPEIRTYAEKGVSKYSEISKGCNEPYLIEIIEASQQVVAGMLYRIKVRLGESTCPKGTRDNCELKADSEVNDYLITVLSQPWIDHGEPEINIVLDTENDVSRSRRSEQIIGGPARISTDDPEIRAYTEKALGKYSETSGDTNEPFLINILEATSQVVSGKLYKIKARIGQSTCSKGIKENCQLRSDSSANDYLITVWSQPWKDNGNPEIKIKRVTEGHERIRRSEQLPGGPMQKSPDDPEIRAYAEKGLSKFSATSGAINEPFLIEIVDATAQVVSGMLYKIKVRLGESTCPKGTKDNCSLKENSEKKIYLITVWSQPWMDNGNPEITIKEHTETTSRKRREVERVGSTEVSKDDPRVKEYARQGVDRYSEKSGLTYEPLLAEITEAAVQTVAGRLYKIRVKIAESNCPKGIRENCRLREDGESDDCLITVLSQPWKDDGKPEIKLECEPKIRDKRSLRGANYSAKMLKLGKNIEYERAFEKFMRHFDVVYPSEEEKTARFRVFKDNMKIIDNLRENERGTAEYGATIFADLTPEEFRAKYTGLRTDLRSDNELPLPEAEIPNVELPKEFDWRHHNIVTEVKNQGSCGSCWAFAVTGNVEGLYALKHGKLLSLSEQELVDCDSFDQGCNGGLPVNAYHAIENLGGLELETDYPYEGEDEKCHFDRNKARVSIASGVNITTNETQMAQWLVQNGPISIGINANAMQFYMGGVSHPFKFLCNADNLDHGVLIVGYGVHTYPIFKKTMPFWIIKNSWGPRWGEQGYYRVYRGDGTCGLNMMATSAVVV